MDVREYIVKPGRPLKVKSFDAGATGDFKDKDAAQKTLAEDIAALADLQEKLIAQAEHGVLIVLQGMDGAGKDGAIKHVMSGINPQGVHVYSFKQPSEEERRHDYLWRAFKVLPERGRIGIFNRSYYEDVVVTRVHPELLGQFRSEERAHGAQFWDDRHTDIRHFEAYLQRNAIHVIKIFLHISKDEQKRRLLRRLDDPERHWKFSPSDVQQRQFWERYVEVYGDMLGATSTSSAPWYIVPADHKWFARTLVAAIVVKRLREIDPAFPADTPQLAATLREQRARLVAED